MKRINRLSKGVTFVFFLLAAIAVGVHCAATHNPLPALMIGGVLTVTRKQIPHVWPGNANTTSIQQLNKSLAYRELYIRHTGQLTLTAVNNTAAGVARGDEWGLIKRLRIVANSSDIVIDVSGDQLWWLNRWYYGQRPFITTTLGDATTVNASYDSTLIIPFWMTRSRKPLDCVFDSGGLVDFRAEITWGTFTDIHANATGFTTTPQITVSSHENELTPQFYPPLVRRTVSQNLIVAGASTNFRFPLDVGPMYRGFLINATTNANPAVDTPALFSNVRLVSGSTVFVDLDEPTLYQLGTIRAGIYFEQEKNTVAAGSPPAINSTGYTGNPRINQKADERAWYNLDLCTDGYLSEAINTGRFNEFYLEFNVPGACQLNVISHQILVNNRAPQNQAA